MRVSAGSIVAGVLSLVGIGWLAGPAAGLVSPDVDPIVARATGVGILALAGLAWWQALRPATRLRRAARRGDGGTVRSLLARGAPADARSPFLRRTPLMEASRGNHLEVLEALLAAGAVVDATARGGVTPLMDAARDGHLETARRLVEAGAEVNAQDDGLHWTAVYLAAMADAGDLVRELARSGARVDHTMTGNVTPLWAAARAGRLEACRALVESGADPGWRVGNDSAIEAAEKKGHHDIARLLRTVEELRAALRAGNESALEDGLQKSPELEPRALASALLPRAIADGAPIAMVRRLLDRGADPDARDAQGRTALMLAVERGASAPAQALIEAGADVNARDAGGATALLVAVGRERNGLVGPLLSAGADPEATDAAGRTALEVAASTKRERLVAALLSGGARRTAAYEKLVAERREREERRRREEAEARERRANKRRETELHGGHQKCARCAAGRPWSIQQTLRKTGMDVTYLSGGARDVPRPANYAGSCPQCRDFFCREHADGDRCAICGSALIG